MQILNAASEAHENQMRKVGEFCLADTVEYKDLGNKEVYIIRKGDKQLRLTAAGNKFDGGFLVVE